MSQYVTPEQYCRRKRINANSLPDDAVAQLDDLLTDASNLVDVIARPVVIDAAEVGEDGDLGALIPIIIQMVARMVRNPDGLTGEQLADYSWQAQGTVQATKLEKRAIRRIVGISSASSVDWESDTNLPPSPIGMVLE